MGLRRSAGVGGRAGGVGATATGSGSFDDGRSRRRCRGQLEQKKASFPAWAIVLIVVAVLVAVVAVIYLPARASQDDKARESSVKEGIHSIQIGVQSWAVDHGDLYPDPSLVSQAGFANYLDFWPTNPYTGLPMMQGTAPGDYSYSVAADRGSFHLTGYGKDGEGIMTVP